MIPPNMSPPDLIPDLRGHVWDVVYYLDRPESWIGLVHLLCGGTFILLFITLAMSAKTNPTLRCICGGLVPSNTCPNCHRPRYPEDPLGKDTWFDRVACFVLPAAFILGFWFVVGKLVILVLN
jgi:hypothetical protein